MTLQQVKKLLREALKELEIEVISDEPDISDDDIKVILEVAKERLLTEMGVDVQEFLEYEEYLKDLGREKGKKKKAELQEALQDVENRIMGKLPPKVETLTTDEIRALVGDSIKQVPVPKPQIINKIERIVEKPTTKIIREKEVVKEIDPSALDEVKNDIQNIQETIGDVVSSIPEPVDLDAFKKQIDENSADVINKKLGQMPNFRALAMGLEARISDLENDELTGEVNSLIAGDNITVSSATGNVTIGATGLLKLDQTTPQTITGVGLKLTAGMDIRPDADSTTAINIAQADGTDFVTFDTTNKHMKLKLDNSKLYFGAGDDASITYDGTDLNIKADEVGTGAVNVLSDQVFVGAGTGLPYGEIYGHNVDVDLVLTTLDQDYQVLAFAVDGNSNLTTPAHGDDHITILKTGVYKVGFSLTVQGAAAVDISSVIKINNGNVGFDCSDVHVDVIAGGKWVTVSNTCLISLTLGDTVELWAHRNDGAASAKTITIDHAVLNLVQIGG